MEMANLKSVFNLKNLNILISPSDAIEFPSGILNQKKPCDTLELSPSDLFSNICHRGSVTRPSVNK